MDKNEGPRNLMIALIVISAVFVIAFFFSPWNKPMRDQFSGKFKDITKEETVYLGKIERIEVLASRSS